MASVSDPSPENLWLEIPYRPIQRRIWRSAARASRFCPPKRRHGHLAHKFQCLPRNFAHRTVAPAQWHANFGGNICPETTFCTCQRLREARSRPATKRFSAAIAAMVIPTIIPVV
ncbi:hypothetical protein TNIN_380621 [Trichonephila inaurata madagascariensis]|uniref:Uncharacterized protein n=1 Tax=Trichonephila inaurata madagascariensis TaxID=2747483 RepID=A0A8X6MHY5_9ARAC|nr:hypothetical protein TNIN_380621 [Trichonephila inaurata madagascariensis]